MQGFIETVRQLERGDKCRVETEKHYFLARVIEAHVNDPITGDGPITEGEANATVQPDEEALEQNDWVPDDVLLTAGTNRGEWQPAEAIIPVAWDGDPDDEELGWEDVIEKRFSVENMEVVSDG